MSFRLFLVHKRNNSMSTKKFIPNIISALRILFSIALMFSITKSVLFYALYIICGISDIADGFLARKFKAESDFGSKLDSSADFIFTAVCFLKLWKFMNFRLYIWLWIFVIAAVKIAAFFANHMKIRHTFANKLAGFLLFIFLPFIHYEVIQILLCIAASAAAVCDFIHKNG